MTIKSWHGDLKNGTNTLHARNVSPYNAFPVPTAVCAQNMLQKKCPRSVPRDTPKMRAKPSFRQCGTDLCQQVRPLSSVDKPPRRRRHPVDFDAHSPQTTYVVRGLCLSKSCVSCTLRMVSSGTSRREIKYCAKTQVLEPRTSPVIIRDQHTGVSNDCR